jgi:ribosome-binding protein aMBF1 (putative translation factor)
VGGAQETRRNHCRCAPDADSDQCGPVGTDSVRVPPVLRDRALIDRSGENLRPARLDRGLSQADLARETGLTVSEISRIERGAREVRLTTMMRLAHGPGASQMSC